MVQYQFWLALVAIWSLLVHGRSLNLFKKSSTENQRELINQLKNEKRDVDIVITINSSRPNFPFNIHKASDQNCFIDVNFIFLNKISIQRNELVMVIVLADEKSLITKKLFFNNEVLSDNNKKRTCSVRVLSDRKTLSKLRKTFSLDEKWILYQLINTADDNCLYKRNFLLKLIGLSIENENKTMKHWIKCCDHLELKLFRRNGREELENNPKHLGLIYLNGKNNKKCIINLTRWYFANNKRRRKRFIDGGIKNSSISKIKKVIRESNAKLDSFDNVFMNGLLSKDRKMETVISDLNSTMISNIKCENINSTFETIKQVAGQSIHSCNTNNSLSNKLLTFDSKNGNVKSKDSKLSTSEIITTISSGDSTINKPTSLINETLNDEKESSSRLYPTNSTLFQQTDANNSNIFARKLQRGINMSKNVDELIGDGNYRSESMWLNDKVDVLDSGIDLNGSSDGLIEKLMNPMSIITTEKPMTIVNNNTHMVNYSQHENTTRITLNQWPVKHSAIVEGDLVLGGLMMVHEREDSITCGPIMPQGGIQALEAMLYTLDLIDQRQIIPGVKIGAHILDDCDKDTYGLEMAVDFIKGSISNIDGAEYHCNKSQVRKVISGVVGAASSVTSIQVANLLRLFRIPQVSFFSTSPELSNKQRFEYFTRTIPSDHHQVKAMVDIVRIMGWSYVSIIYEESNYGIKAFEELEELLAKYQICIAIKEKLVKDSGVADETAYDNIVQKLLTKPRARGCIIFGSDQEVAGVMRAVRRNNATGAFYWIGSDGWSARGLVSNKNEAEVEGTLSVQPQANPVLGFQQYFLNLTVENNRRNPWFVEFWEDHFQCRYPNSPATPYNQKYTTPCTTNEKLTKYNTAFEDQLQFVSDAVTAFAYAFRDMHSDLCLGKPGLCDAMKPTKGDVLLKYLRKVEFQGLSGDQFHFDKNGDGPARYNIIHFKQITSGIYKWIRVGEYLEGELHLNMSEIQFRMDNPQPPESVCSSPCRVGQAKKYVEGESCCWHCLDCTQYQIRHETDQTRCVMCMQGTIPDETHSYCQEIPEEFLRPESGWAIGAISFSASGILVTLFVGGVFIKHNDTPIVRASGRELSYILLTGILLCYLVTFILILKPTDIVCGMQRFLAGFCFTVVYAALLTKTNRISRIFNKSKKSAKRPSFISPRSQIIICSLLIGVQILINGVWMIIDPAKARHHYPTREDNLLVCNSYIDASYMIAFTYPIILIIVCTVYAVLTRKIPEDFNESKHIGFTMYTTCVIWLAFVPLYFGTGNHVALRITSMSVTISLSASVTIACLFSPKLYIILIHPERNIRRGRGPFAPKPSTINTRTNPNSMISNVTLSTVQLTKSHITTNDSSTQSECYEMELKERKNGNIPSITRSTQTLINNEKNSIKETSDKDNNIKIGNGPLNKNDLSS